LWRVFWLWWIKWNFTWKVSDCET